jgi:hypothetical protein
MINNAYDTCMHSLILFVPLLCHFRKCELAHESHHTVDLRDTCQAITSHVLKTKPESVESKKSEGTLCSNAISLNHTACVLLRR